MAAPAARASADSSDSDTTQRRKAWFTSGRALLDAAGALAGRPPRLVPLTGTPGTVALLTTPDAQDTGRALTPEKYPDWRPEVAARSGLRAGFYRPGRLASRVACPLLVVVANQDQSALAEPSVRAARSAPRGELVRLAGSHYAPFLDAHEQVVEAELSFLRRHLTERSPATATSSPATATTGGRP